MQLTAQQNHVLNSTECTYTLATVRGGKGGANVEEVRIVSKHKPGKAILKKQSASAQDALDAAIDELAATFKVGDAPVTKEKELQLTVDRLTSESASLKAQLAQLTDLVKGALGDKKADAPDETKTDAKPETGTLTAKQRAEAAKAAREAAKGSKQDDNDE